MATIPVKGLDGLARRLPQDMRARERRIGRGIAKTVSAGAKVVRSRVPVAFGELRDSVHTDDHRIIVDAPHAAAVEKGSRPHWVPLDALIRWVKLRGMQGLSGRSLKRLSGTTTAGHAVTVRQQLSEMARGRGGYNSVDDPVEIAKAIQLAIAKKGTKPHYYMLGSLPTVEEILDVEIKLALPDP